MLEMFEIVFLEDPAATVFLVVPFAVAIVIAVIYERFR